jgi:trehalose 6-phosphate synthase
VQVLSRFAGAAEQLREALLVNPYDTEATASSINMALQMPVEERRERYEALMKTIRRYDVHWWCDTFLDTLAKAKAEETGTPWLRL